MSTYVVGDIQGCLQALKCLMRHVNFTPGRDILWSVGDTVNRGPQSLETLRFLYRMREHLVMVLGNHDLHLLAAAAGVRAPSRSDTFEEIFDAPDRQELLDWLTQQPLIHHAHDHTLVHAGIPPQWSIKQALGLASEVEDVLQSQQRVKFFTKMYGDQPDIWSNELSGMKRLRVITNYLTRMRYCTTDGRLDLKNKGSSLDGQQSLQRQDKLLPWFQHKNRKAAKERILFGHWATLGGVTNTANAIALDTGCVWGGAMTFYHLETRQWTRCNCSAGKCRNTPVTANA